MLIFFFYWIYLYIYLRIFDIVHHFMDVRYRRDAVTFPWLFRHFNISCRHSPKFASPQKMYPLEILICAHYPFILWSNVDRGAHLWSHGNICSRSLQWSSHHLLWSSVLMFVSFIKNISLFILSSVWFQLCSHWNIAASAEIQRDLRMVGLTRIYNRLFGIHRWYNLYEQLIQCQNVNSK